MTKPLRTYRARHAFRRNFDRLRRSLRAKEWLGTESTRLTGTETGVVFTATGADPNFGAVGNGFTDGEGPYQVTTAGTLPAGLDADEDYYVINVATDTFQLAVGRDRRGVIVTPGDAGTGAHTITKRPDQSGIFSNLRFNKANTVEATADIDDLR